MQMNLRRFIRNCLSAGKWRYMALAGMIILGLAFFYSPSCMSVMADGVSEGSGTGTGPGTGEGQGNPGGGTGETNPQTPEGDTEVTKPGTPGVTNPQNPGGTPGGNPGNAGNSQNIIKKGYQVVRTAAGKLQCYYNGKLQKNKYFNIKKNGSVYQVIAPKKKGGFVYYFNASGNGKKWSKSGTRAISYNGAKTKCYLKKGKILTGWMKKKGKKYYYVSGKMVTGWKKVGKYKYFFQKGKKKGMLLTNTIAGTKKTGYYYVDSKGIRVTSNEIKLAVKFVRDHTKSSQSNSSKLRTCYGYLWRNYSYKRYYGESPSSSDMSRFARDMLTYKRGNCFRYAASFAYIARVLGYDVKVGIGMISAARGGMTPHGWTEVRVGRSFLICDPDMQKNHPSKNVYMKSSGNYPYRHYCTRRYHMTINKGKVSWGR